MKTTYAIISLLWLITPVCAKTELPFESTRPLYVGARALGMGNAFTAVADDASAGFWNPAGLIQWQGVKLFAVNKFHDRSEYRFDPKGIGYSYRGYSLFWGNKIAIGVDSGVPDFNYYGIARQLGPYAAAGLSLKFKRRHPSNVYQFFGYETTYDLGVLFKPHPDFKFGCLAQNLEGFGIQWLTLGIAYRYAEHWLKSAPCEFSVDVAVPTAGETPELYIGAEWHPLQVLHIRLGSSNGVLTTGIGIAWKGVGINYARIFEKPSTSDFIGITISL
ncbi:MAG: hypothetical protein OXH39_05955 [Candidatus Poribacteria bacterium]|nr:hypothetical protein [Candidatus Poribacteria bacterium]